MPAVAVVFGLLCALSWGSSSIFGARASRAYGALATTFWVQVAGLALIVPFALQAGVPDAPGDDWLLAALAGIAYLGGSACWTFAVRLGAVGIVTMLVATDGAIAATTSALLGEEVGLPVAAALAIVVAGVLLATRPGEHARVTRTAVLLGLLGAVSFATVFVAGGRATGMELPWVLLVTRSVATVLLLPIALQQRSGVPRGAFRDVILMAATDTAGYAFYLAGAARSLAIAAVISAQYALVTVIISTVAFHERLTRTQIAGVLLTVTGVATVAALQAT
jgi:drug/metabolite transporter (DMT)-like permease